MLFSPHPLETLREEELDIPVIVDEPKKPREILEIQDPFFDSDVFTNVYNQISGILSTPTRSLKTTADGQTTPYTYGDLLKSDVPQSNIALSRRIGTGRGQGTTSAVTNDEFFRISLAIQTILNDEKERAAAEKAGVDLQSLSNYSEHMLPVFDDMFSRIRANDFEPTGYQIRQLDKLPEDEKKELQARALSQRDPIALGRLLYEGTKEFVEPGVEQRNQQLSLRGVPLDNLDKSYEEIAPLPDDYYFRVGVSPIHSTEKEYYNIIRNFDPTAQVFYADPTDRQAGLLILSKFNPKDENGNPTLLPVRSTQATAKLLSGEYEPALRALATFGAQEGPSIGMGGALFGVARKVAKERLERRINKARLSRETEKLPDPEDTTYITKIPTVFEIPVLSLGIAGSEGAIRFGQLMVGAATDVQPDLTLRRALQDTGALVAASAIGGAQGDIAIRSFGRMYSFFTGRPVSDGVVNELIAESRILHEQIEGLAKGNIDELPEAMPLAMKQRIAEVIQDSITRRDALSEAELETVVKGGAFTKPTDTINPIVLRDLSDEAADELIKILRTQEISLGTLTDNQRVALLEELVLTYFGSDKVGIDLENLSRNNAIIIDQFYQALVRRTGLDPETASELGISKKNLNDIFRGLRGKQLIDELSEEERKLLELRASENLETLLPVEGGAAQQAAANIQESVRTSPDTVFPDEKSRLLMMRNDQLEQTRAEINRVLEDPIYDTDISLRPYIEGSLKEFLDANKAAGTVFGNPDAVEAAEVIREMLPNREAEGISIALLTQQPREGGRFGADTKFDQRTLIQARDNLYSVFNGHPNKVVREKGEKLLADFDRAINDNYKAMYRKQTGKRSAPSDMNKVFEEVGEDYRLLNTQLRNQQQSINSRFLLDLVKQDETRIGSFVLNANPRDVRKLTQFLGETGIEGVEKLEAVRTAVLAGIEKELDLPNVGAAEAAKRFESILKNKRDQIEILFPEDTVKFDDIRNFLSTAKQATIRSEARIAQINKELDQIKLDDGTVPSLTDFLDGYFNLSADRLQNITESQQDKIAQNIGKVAEGSPQLRKALQDYFAENVLLKFRGTDFTRRTGVPRMLDAGGPDDTFNIEKLNELILRPFQTDAEAARYLAPIVGEKVAKTYAKDLRILARMTLRQKGFSGNPIEKYAAQYSRQQIKEELAGKAGTVRRVIRAGLGPLNKLATRLNVANEVLFETLNGKKLENLGKIAADPAKLKAYIQAENRKLPALTMWHITNAIATDQSSDAGSEDISARESLMDTLLTLTADMTEVDEQVYQYLTETFGLDDE